MANEELNGRVSDSVKAKIIEQDGVIKAILEAF